jgi:hypothetical protein
VKVQIIYLTPEDDIHSTRDMLSWVKAPRALLVWPDRGRVLSRRLDLVLLKRYASQRQMQIGLLTFDPDIRKDAHEVGIPLFESLETLPEERWQPLQSSSSYITEIREGLQTSPDEWRDRNPISTQAISFLEKNRVPFLVLIILLLLIVFATFYPTAEIILTPRRMSDQIEISVPFAFKGEGILSSGAVEAEKIQFRVSGSDTRPATGRVYKPVSPSEGRVIFTSHVLQALDVPKGTLLRTDDEIAFQTMRDVSLPAEIGAQADVAVRAMLPGRAANVPAGSITRVVGALGLLLSVGNPQGTSGGEDALFPSVTQYDLDRLEESLLEDLLREGEEHFHSEMIGDRIFIEGSSKVSRILERVFDHDAGEVAEELTLSLDVEIEGIVIRPESLWEAIRVDLGRGLPDGQALIPESFLVREARLESADGSGPPQLSLMIDRGTYAWIDLGELKEQCLGLSPSDAILWLDKALNLTQPAIVRLRPKWFPVLPWIGGQIEIYFDWEHPAWEG